MRYHGLALQAGNKGMRRSALILTIVSVLGIAYLVYTFAHPPWTALRITGLAVMSPALALMIVARIRRSERIHWDTLLSPIWG
jgi:hypothetical protein